MLGKLFLQRRKRGHVDAVHGEDEISSLKPRCFRTTSRLDGANADPRGASIHLDSQIGPLNPAEFHQVVGHLGHNGRGNGEGIARVGACLGCDGGVDADEVAVQIDQGASAVARIDCGIGLEKTLHRMDVLGCVGFQEADVAAFGADDSGCDGRGQIERVADGQHPLADAHVVGVSEGHGGQGSRRLNLQDGQVGAGVAADHLCGVGLSIGGAHPNVACTLDDVVVGDNQAFVVHDHAAPGALRHAASSHAQHAEPRVA